MTTKTTTNGLKSLPLKKKKIVFQAKITSKIYHWIRNF